MSKEEIKGLRASLEKGVNLGLIATRIFLKTRTRASLGKNNNTHFNMEFLMSHMHETNFKIKISLINSPSKMLTCLYFPLSFSVFYKH